MDGSSLCRCGHPFRDHGGITIGGSCQAGGCDLCEVFELQPAALFVIFDGPPGPVSGRFVEVETEAGVSLRAGEWIERPDGYWALRIEPEALDRAARMALVDV